MGWDIAWVKLGVELKLSWAVVSGQRGWLCSWGREAGFLFKHAMSFDEERAYIQWLVGSGKEVAVEGGGEADVVSLAGVLLLILS